MVDNAKEQTLNNPISAITETFLHPFSVFNTLAVKNNWSWVPFFLLAFVLFFPPYLYYSVVDFDWFSQISADALLGDVSPAERQNYLDAANLSLIRISQAISNSLVAPIIVFAVLALYYNFITRNDEKSVQGFSDWYGAMWWMALPSLLNALVAIILISLQSENAQIHDNIMVPFSLAYIANTTIASPMHSLFNVIRLDVFWSLYLGFVCLRSWTNFSVVKAIATVTAPYLLLLILLVLSA